MNWKKEMVKFLIKSLDMKPGGLAGDINYCRLFVIEDTSNVALDALPGVANNMFREVVNQLMKSKGVVANHCTRCSKFSCTRPLPEA